MKTTEEIREEQAKPRTVGDMKHGLGGARPALSLVPRTGAIYSVRATEYGADKYARGNYHGPPPTKLGANAGVMRLLGYIDATMRHLMHVSDKINRALGTGGDLAAACACVDDEASGNFPASMLPHLAHALASMNIGISCAVDDGLLPADPGQPWKKAITVEPGLPQKDDPAAEKARVAALAESPFKVGDRVFVRCTTSVFNNRIGTIGKITSPTPIGAYLVEFKDGACWLHKSNIQLAIEKTRDSNGFDNDTARDGEVRVEMRKDPQTGYIVPATSLEEALKNLPDVDVQAKTNIDFPKRREPNQ